MKKQEVLKLANLARIQISDEEAEKLLPDLDAILNYVSLINNVSGKEVPEKKVGILHNVMREDDASHDSGAYTEELLHEAPLREGDYIKVKKIL